MLNRSFKFTNIIFLLAISILIISNTLLYFQNQRLIQANQWVVHSYQVLNHLTQVELELNDSASAHRNYLQTKNSAYLNNLNASLTNLKNHINFLKFLTNDNPRQVQSLLELDPEID